MRILFTCGGTGGHIYPAIAMLDTFKRQQPDLEYLFVGSDYGLLEEILQKNGINQMSLIKSRGLVRGISLKNISSMVLNLIAFFQAKVVIKSFQPDLVVSTGDYPTFHITYYAVKRKIPLFLIESNGVPGLVTRLFAKEAKAVFAASTLLHSYFKDPINILVVGTPSRIKKTTKSPSQIKGELGLIENEKVITVMGGSCGSNELNDSMIQMINQMEIPCQIVWATGKKQVEQVRSRVKKDHFNLHLVDYIDNMNEVLSITDVVVCRAGASTLQEVKEFGIPAILVPFAKATNNHQTINAVELQDAGAATIIKEGEINGTLLQQTIHRILFEENRLEQMRLACSKIKRENCNEQIYEIMMREMGGIIC